MKRLAAMGAMRLSVYLKEEGKVDFWSVFPRLLDREITRDRLEELEAPYFDRIEEDEQGIRVLYELLRPQEDEAGRMAWCCLELAVLFYMNSQIGEVFAAVYGPARHGATLALAAKLLYGEAAILEDYRAAEEAFSRCELILQADYPVRRMGDALLQADDRLIQWMGQMDRMFHHPFVKVSHLRKEVPSALWETVRNSFITELNGCAAVEEGEMILGVISGESGSGRRYLVQQTAADLGWPMLMVDVSYFGSLEQTVSRWRRLLREVLLQPVLICITDVAAEPTTESLLRILVQEYETVIKRSWEWGIHEAPARRPLFLTTTESVKPIPMLHQRIVQRHLTMPGLEARAGLWEYFGKKYLPTVSLPAQELAVKMKLPLGSVEKIVKRLACLPAGEAMESRTIFRYCYELLDDGRYDNIKRVETHYTYDDLKLEDSQKQIIKDICAQVEYRKQVMSDWNLQSRYSYGTSISALFTGPPGTGKTMAVHVMAGILGLELFKVDLSQIVDKYIGETEKRLEEVFQKASRSNMILFFDEADAIIGKRSETKESKDKYANTEVAFLLQRMEEYDGIVILATNYSQNIDAAFMRRIRFTVHFDLPDAATRKEIWKSAFAPETPVGDLDYEYLSSQFEFSGGQIKNVVWNACFFAAMDGGAVEMCHLVRAIQKEFTKDKKVSFQEVLGAYAYLLY